MALALDITTAISVLAPDWARSASSPVARPGEEKRALDFRDAADEVLLAAAREGDQMAFRALVERFHEALARTVVSMLGPGDAVDDVLQDVFIQFYKNIGKFRGDSSVKTYLNRIAVNRSLDVLRRRKRSFKRLIGLDDPSVGEMADADQRAPEVDHVVWKAIDRLSSAQRAVVTLRLVEGYSTEETAEILGVRYGTVLSRLSRACDNLKDMLTPLLNEGDRK